MRPEYHCGDPQCQVCKHHPCPPGQGVRPQGKSLVPVQELARVFGDPVRAHRSRCPARGRRVWREAQGGGMQTCPLGGQSPVSRANPFSGQSLSASFACFPVGVAWLSTGGLGGVLTGGMCEVGPGGSLVSTGVPASLPLPRTLTGLLPSVQWTKCKARPGLAPLPPAPGAPRTSSLQQAAPPLPFPPLCGTPTLPPPPSTPRLSTEPPLNPGAHRRLP